MFVVINYTPFQVTILTTTDSSPVYNRNRDWFSEDLLRVSLYMHVHVHVSLSIVYVHVHNCICIVITCTCTFSSSLVYF